MQMDVWLVHDDDDDDNDDYCPPCGCAIQESLHLQVPQNLWSGRIAKQWSVSD